MTCVLVVIGLLAGWVLVEDRVHDEIRRTFEQKLAEHYTHFRVSVRAARMIEGRGVEIHGVTISERDGRTPVAYIDEGFVTCRIGLQELLSGEKPEAKHLMIHGLKMWAHERQDGSWNLERLWPLPQFGREPPPATIKEAVVEIVVGKGEIARKLSLRKFNAEIAREPVTPDGDSSLPREVKSPYRISGTLEGDHFETADFRYRIDPNAGSWTLGGAIDGLQLSPELYAVVPAQWQGKAAQLSSVAGRAKLDFAASKHGAKDEPIQFSFSGAFANGQIADSRLPMRLYDLQGEFCWDNDGLTIRDMSARNGSSTLWLSLERGFDQDSRFALQAEARQLHLDRRFVEVLPERFQDVWLKYSPNGVIDANVSLVFDGRQWSRDIRVTCHDVSLVYYKFPYRVERARGTIAWKDDILNVQLNAMAGGQVATIKGVVRNPDRDPTGWMEVACERPIPIDEKLMSALVDPKAQAIVRSFRPSGSVLIAGRFWRQSDADPRFHRDVRIDLHNCAIQYEKFPYPLSMIRGTLLWKDQGWTFENLSGRNDSGFIECKGSWGPSEQGGSLLEMDFVGVDVPLEEELRRALNPNAKQMWSELRPRGSIDELVVNLRYPSTTKKLSLDVMAHKRMKNANDEERSISIYPVWFPYRLDDVSGTCYFRDGDVRLEKVKGVHDETQIEIDGQCNFTKDGLWEVHLTNVFADGVRFDRELLTALPEGLSRSVAKLNLRGDISMQGSIDLAGNTSVGGPPTAHWDVKFDVEDGSLNCGFVLDHIHGDIELNGRSSQHGFYSRGDLNVVSMFYGEIQLTQVHGPLMIDPTRIVLGAEADRERADGPPRPLTAKLIGGDLAAGAEVRFDGDTPFVFQMQLDRGDLAEFAQEMALKTRNIRGKANALITLTGNRYGRNSWRGDGHVRIYEADIYEIPVMLALLKLLTIRPPDTTAFTSSEIDFRIQGEHAYFDRIDFHGDAISLKGTGEATMDHQINLRFYTLVGKREFSWALLRAALQQVGKQILMIHVTGTLEQPNLVRQPLPVLRETLDQIFPELANRPKPERSSPVRPLEPLRQRLSTERR